MVHSATLARLVMLAALLSPVAVRAGDDAKRLLLRSTPSTRPRSNNDWQTMDRILHPEFTLVVGSGKSFSQPNIASARNQDTIYEKQVEMPGTQTVRLFGDDTATVTALLWLKGKRKGQVVDESTGFDYKLWFTDTYVRTAAGWKYAGQAPRLPDSTTAPTNGAGGSARGDAVNE
jgi:hypothetical protein